MGEFKGHTGPLAVCRQISKWYKRVGLRKLTIN